MPDFATKDFVATMGLDRTWSITLIDPDNTEPHSAAVWWVDHCDDDGRQLVRGVMPFRVYCGKRPRAQLYLNQIQRAYQSWVNRGCPVYEAA